MLTQKTAALQSTSDGAPARKRHKADAPAVPVSPWFIQPASSLDGLIIQRKSACACGGGCPECNDELEELRGQMKLAISAPGDPLEQEADRVADQVLATPTPSPGTHTPPLVQHVTGQTRGTATAPASLERVLADSGSPLDPKLRHDMEERIGYDFSRVRVHSGRIPEQSAGDVNARAYTVGEDIVFGSGQFAPHSREGRHLLAHELTHVAQQGSGRVSRQVQRKPDRKEAAGATKTIAFRIKVDREMTAEQLLHEFVKQYYGYTTEAQVATKIGLWTNSSNVGATAADAARGFIDASVTTAGQTDLETLAPTEKKAISAETDKRFWESTGYKPGQKLGTSSQDKEMARVWIGLRNAILTEDKQRKDIEALPDDIKKVLFAGGVDAAAASPENYTQLLSIAQKLASLAPEERKDYLDRINASTTSLNAFEASIDAYIRFRAERKRQEAEHEDAAKPLLNADDVYDSYRFWQLYLKNFDELGPDASKEDQEFVKGIKDDNERALLQELKDRGFDSIDAFETLIEAYRIAFRTQAVNLALDVLARYDHMLYEERTKLAQPGAAAAIATGIAATEAAALYKEAQEQETIAENLGGAHELHETWWIAPKLAADERARAARAKAESEVIRGSGNDPLVAERKTDREKLAGLNAAGVEAYLLETVNKRSEDVRTARQEFQDDPDRVFKLPDLIAASEQLQGIEPDTVYGKIIRHHMEDERARHLLSAIAIGIIAIALAFLVPGGGWLAAAALVANAGISTYQAVVAYKEYEEQERDYTLHFLSQEPSLFWVGVAIAAAALDLGMATSALIKESALALKTLEGPLSEFAKGGEAATLLAKIEAAEGLRTEVKLALEREAAAAAAAREAWKDVGGRASAFVPGSIDPGLAKQGFRALYYSIKRGINTIVRLRADAKFIGAIGDITRMSGAERAELEAAFEEVKQLVQAGGAKSMDEGSLLGFIDRWAINRSKPGFRAKLLDEMSHWKPLTAEQEKALANLAERRTLVAELYDEQQALLAEREELLKKQGNPATRSAKNRETLQDINERLSELDPSFNKATVKKRVTTVGPDGEPVETLVDVPVEHPPGAIEEAEIALSTAEKEAARANLSLYDRLRAATPSIQARERALKGVTVDQVGPLKTKPTPLHPDHIISVRELCDMDGFADLLWKDQKAIADMKANLIAMDGAANLSKGDRTVRSWNQASNFYWPETIENMAKREAEVRPIIEAEIKERLAKMAAGKP